MDSFRYFFSSQISAKPSSSKGHTQTEHASLLSDQVVSSSLGCRTGNENEQNMSSSLSTSICLVEMLSRARESSRSAEQRRRLLTGTM